jgi:hypothetical protein
MKYAGSIYVINGHCSRYLANQFTLAYAQEKRGSDPRARNGSDTRSLTLYAVHWDSFCKLKTNH